MLSIGLLASLFFVGKVAFNYKSYRFDKPNLIRSNKSITWDLDCFK